MIIFFTLLPNKIMNGMETVYKTYNKWIASLHGVVCVLRIISKKIQQHPLSLEPTGPTGLYIIR